MKGGGVIFNLRKRRGEIEGLVEMINIPSCE